MLSPLRFSCGNDRKNHRNLIDDCCARSYYYLVIRFKRSRGTTRYNSLLQMENTFSFAVKRWNIFSYTHTHTHTCTQRNLFKRRPVFFFIYWSALRYPITHICEHTWFLLAWKLNFAAPFPCMHIPNCVLSKWSPVAADQITRSRSDFSMTSVRKRKKSPHNRCVWMFSLLVGATQ